LNVNYDSNMIKKYVDSADLTFYKYRQLSWILWYSREVYSCLY